MAQADLGRWQHSLAGGITLVESWEIAGESITNRELRRRSAAILPMIREGRSFTEGLEAAAWMPPLALDMIGIGERSGGLREMLDEVAVFFDAGIRGATGTVDDHPRACDPCGDGGVVIMILLAIYMPIINSLSSGGFGSPTELNRATAKTILPG